MKNNALKQALQNVKNKTQIPVSALTNDLELAQVVSKLVKDPIAKSRRDSMERYNANQGIVRSIADSTAQKIGDARNFLQLLPDLKMGIDILISSILSPKDMIEVSTLFTSETNMVPLDVLSSLNAISTDYFVNSYKINELLPTVLREVLVETGSYAIAVLPENAVDDIINRGRSLGVESHHDLADSTHLFANLGILGEPKKTTISRKLSFAFEDYSTTRATVEGSEAITGAGGKDIFVHVSDNPNLLKAKLIRERLSKGRINSILGIGSALESYTGIDLTGDNVNGHIPIYKDAPRQMSPLIIVKTQDQLKRHSAGSPLILHLPSESVVPVFTPGQPNEHIGYFIAIDENGAPLNVSKDVDYFMQLRNNMSSNSDATSNLVQRMTNQYENNDYANAPKINAIIDAYTDMIEEDLNIRLKNGLIDGEVKLNNVQQIMNIMMMRSLRQQYTQMLYVPRELLTYIATDFNEYGIGKSLLDDMKIILSLRVVTTFANTMAAVRNSVGRTGVNIKFDEYDSDPWKTLETIMGEINRTRTGTGSNLPIGASGPAEVVDWLAKAGYEFTFEGHPAMPDIKIDYDEKNTSYARTDTDLDEDLRKRTLMAISVPPELVDSAFSPDFATVAVNNSIMLSKRVIQIQDKVKPYISEHCRKIISNDANLVKQLREAVTVNIDVIIKRLVDKEEFKSLNKDTVINDQVKNLVIDAVVRDYIEYFNVTLPRPNTVELSNQADAFKTYSETLDEAIKYFMDNTFANNDSMGELGDKLEVVREALKAMMMRKWMSENSFLPELFDLVVEDENGNISSDIHDEIASHNDKLIKVCYKFIQSIQPMKKAGDKFLEGLDDEGNNDSDNSDDGSGSGDDASDDESGNDGLDDFNFDDDTSGEEGDAEGDSEDSSSDSDNSGNNTDNNSSGSDSGTDGGNSGAQDSAGDSGANEE